jgi:hypothetical protein
MAGKEWFDDCFEEGEGTGGRLTKAGRRQCDGDERSLSTGLAQNLWNERRRPKGDQKKKKRKRKAKEAGAREEKASSRVEEREEKRRESEST